MPNPEFTFWKILYALEPFGWGAHHAWLYNLHRDPKKGKPKNEDDLLNDRAAEILRELRPPPDLSGMSAEEKRAYMLNQIKKDFRIK